MPWPFFWRRKPAAPVAAASPAGGEAESCCHKEQQPGDTAGNAKPCCRGDEADSQPCCRQDDAPAGVVDGGQAEQQACCRQGGPDHAPGPCCQQDPTGAPQPSHAEVRELPCLAYHAYLGWRGEDASLAILCCTVLVKRQCRHAWPYGILVPCCRVSVPHLTGAHSNPCIGAGILFIPP